MKRKVALMAAVVALLLGTAGEAQAAPERPAQLTVQEQALVNQTAVAAIQQIDALAAPSSIIVSTAKGSDWWYASALNSAGMLRTVVRIRYSWSWMWWIHDHMDTIAAMSGVACGLLKEYRLTTACGAVVVAYYAYMKSKINEGLRYKKCVLFQLAAPPLVDYSLTRVSLVTCRI